MKQTMNLYNFLDEFKKIRPNNFSRDGLTALYNYLVELEGDINEEFEFKSVEDIWNTTPVIEIPPSDRFIVQNF